MKSILSTLITSLFPILIFSQVPSIGDVKGTTDEPGKTNSPYKKALQQANYSGNNYFSGSLNSDFSGYGFSLNSEIAKKFQSKTYYTLRFSLGTYNFFQDFSTKLSSIEFGLLRVLHNFDSYDGDNSLYTRFNSGPFLSLSNKAGNYNPTFSNDYSDSYNGIPVKQLSQRSVGADYFGAGMKSNLKFGYMVKVFQDYSLNLETGYAYYWFGHSEINQTNFFSPEFSIGVQKQNLLEW